MKNIVEVARGTQQGQEWSFQVVSVILREGLPERTVETCGRHCEGGAKLPSGVLPMRHVGKLTLVVVGGFEVFEVMRVGSGIPQPMLGAAARHEGLVRWLPQESVQQRTAEEQMQFVRVVKVVPPERLPEWIVETVEEIVNVEPTFLQERIVEVGQVIPQEGLLERVKIFGIAV